MVNKDAPNGCWEWTGYRHRQQYGRFKWQGQMRLAHRLSWEFTHGPISSGLHVLHRCDNTPCVNPEHLFLGHHNENMSDMHRKGRHAHGERAGNSVLRNRDILKVKALHATGLLSHSELALIAGVDKSQISRIINRKTWKHV
jgi:hypothetical protein